MRSDARAGSFVKQRKAQYIKDTAFTADVGFKQTNQTIEILKIYVIWTAIKKHIFKL